MGSRSVGVRAVFDTNVVISALVFRTGRLSWLRSAWREGEFVPVVNDETVKELLRVLGYPKFHLERDDIAELLGDYLPYAEVWSVPVSPSGVALRDSDDVKFLDLAIAADVELLVSGDKHLQGVSGDWRLSVVTPEALTQSR